MTNIKYKKEGNISKSDTITETKEKFVRHIIHENAIATNDIRSNKFDMDKAKQKSNAAMTAMNIDGGLQSMLAAQMFSIHELQQRTMIYANAADDLELKKYYTNAAIKLANCFTQQANILAKLQGVGGQKIIVERVDVHQGGQAVVGNIQG
ncbi:hypothetical protein [Legionella donaldsonii]|uniref:hypothetical protein n=1 Tax=Legionella donaldsonii TaxID=45060 RepID=UPI00399C55C1